MMTIHQALTAAIQALQSRSDIAQWATRDANLILQYVLDVQRTHLLAHPEQILTAEQQNNLNQLIEGRLHATPIQYLVKEQEFYGRAFHVTPDVLIPRPETELIIDAVKQHVLSSAMVHIVDVGTGSGILAVTLAAELPLAHITAIDISPAALAIAKKNAERHNVADRITFLESDLLEKFSGTAEIIVSNPPYIAESDRPTLHPQVSEHEPSLALFAGADGNDIYRRLIPQAWQTLAGGGWLFMELGTQGQSLNPLFDAWKSVRSIEDLQGIPRVLVACRP